MRKTTLGVVTSCLLSVFLDSSFAQAESGATLVAIVTSEPNAALTRRVSAELRGLGVDVIVLKPPAEASTQRAPLEQAARSVGAIAAVRLIASSEGKVEVWVADRVTGKAVVRELDAPGYAGGAAGGAAGAGVSDEAVAVGTVELLRASLMELHSAEPPHGDLPATAKVEALALPTTSAAPWVPRLGIGVGAGAELGVRGLGPSPDADLSVWVRVASRFGVRVLAYTSLAPAHVETGVGSLDVESQMFGAMATYAFTRESTAWEPSVSVGVAAARVSTTGSATPPFVSASAAAWCSVPLIDLGLAWAFERGLRLRADGLVGWAIPSTVISTATATVGRWGAPALTLSLGIEVLWGR
jgi:hypothetical protein